MTVRETSRAVFADIIAEGLLNRMERVAYEIVMQHGPVTAREADRIRGHMKRSLQPAMHRLVKRGALAETGKRKCRETGRCALTYVVTDTLPGPPPPKLTLTKRMKSKAADALREAWPQLSEAQQKALEPVGKWLAKGAA